MRNKLQNGNGCDKGYCTHIESFNFLHNHIYYIFGSYSNTISSTQQVKQFYCNMPDEHCHHLKPCSLCGTCRILHALFSLCVMKLIEVVLGYALVFPKSTILFQICNSNPQQVFQFSIYQTNRPSVVLSASLSSTVFAAPIVSMSQFTMFIDFLYIL